MNDTGDALRRFERRLQLRLDLTVVTRRAVSSIPAAIQIVVGVLLSYSFAHFVLGHPSPLLSVTVVLSTLGFSRDARPRRVLESVVGILVGIVLSELILLLVGQGVWQIALVLFVTILVARAASSNPAFAVIAATQGMLVLLIPAPPGGPFVRSIDALVAGVVALLMTALVPRDTRRIAVRDARNLASVLSQAMASLLEGVVESNVPAANLAVERLRSTQRLIDDWSTSLDSAFAVARISPFLRRQQALLTGFDLAARHLRVISRRIYFLLKDGGGRSELPELLGSIAAAIDLLGESIGDAGALAKARAALTELAPTLDPATLMPHAPVSESVIVMLVRPLVIDLLVATGVRADDARALLPVV